MRRRAFVSAIVLDHRYGLNNGFDTYDDEMSGAAERSARETLDRAERWVGRRSPALLSVGASLRAACAVRRRLLRRRGDGGRHRARSLLQRASRPRDLGRPRRQRHLRSRRVARRAWREHARLLRLRRDGPDPMDPESARASRRANSVIRCESSMCCRP